MNRKTIGLVFALSITTGLSGCNGGSDEIYPEIRTAIKSNQSLWQQAELIDYTFTFYSEPTDCPTADPVPPRTIVVEDGKVVESKSEAYEITQLLNEPTIDTVFNDMLRATEQTKKAYGLKPSSSELPQFHTTLGYPIQYYVDISNNECDGYIVYISNFQ